jgi:integrase/recombinase XerC/integrase/recombinase XerD
LRISECQTLTWAQLDFGANTVRVIGKGRKERIVPLTHAMKNWFQLYRRNWKKRAEYPH